MPSTTAIAEAVAPVINSIEAAAPPVSVQSRSRRWYAINRKDTNEAEITIYEEIGGFGITAEDFIKDLKEITASRINLRLNTPGGEVFEATAIYNALAEHPAEIIVYIDGVAASAGSYIAMSGDEVRMADNAYMMIHNARGGVVGEATDMRQYADVLDKMNDNIAMMYEKRAGKTREHWRGLMDAETWFNADEAKAEGLADVVYSAAPTNRITKPAAFDVRIYNKIPDAVRGLWGIPTPPPVAPVTQEIHAPEVSRESEPPPAVHTQESLPMASDVTVSTAAPAQTPAAPASPEVPQGNPQPPVSRSTELEMLRNATAQAKDEAAHRRGFEQGTTAATKRLQAIRDACPGNPQMAMDAFLGGQSPEAVKLAFEAAERVRLEAVAREEATNMEMARLKAMLAVGGHSGVDMDYANSDDDDAMSTVDPKARAEQEWDQRPSVRKGFSAKANYVAYRVRELQGTVARQTASA